LRRQDLPDRYQRQVEDQLAKPLVTETLTEQREPSKYDIDEEKKLQAICERYLNQRGYKRLKAEIVVIYSTAPKGSHDMPNGYFGHWFNNRRNPFILDLLILSPTGHYLMVDLKVSNHYQPGQKEIVVQGYGHFAWSLDDFIVILNKWEKNIRVKKLGKNE